MWVKWKHWLNCVERKVMNLLERLVVENGCVLIKSVYICLCWRIFLRCASIDIYMSRNCMCLVGIVTCICNHLQHVFTAVVHPMIFRVFGLLVMFWWGLEKLMKRPLDRLWPKISASFGMWSFFFTTIKSISFFIRSTDRWCRHVDRISFLSWTVQSRVQN